MEARGGSALDRGEIDVAGIRRSFWLARAPRRPGQSPPPLLIALHGPGTDGRGMAGFTGLAGHRSTGGCRASLFNGITQEMVDRLTDFMGAFEFRNRCAPSGVRGVQHAVA